MNFKNTILAITILIAGCQSKTKNDGLVTKTTNILTQKSNNLISEGPQNPDNPYDSAGKLHNEILEKLHKHIQQTGDTSNADVRRYLSAYFKKYRGTDIANALAQIPDSLSRQIISDYRKVVFAQNWNPVTANYLQSVFDTISKAGNDSFATLKAKIVNIEKQILNNYGLPFREKRMLLYTTSIARYSAFYWNGILEQHSGRQTAARGIWHALKRALAFVCTCIGDASGAAYAYLLEAFDKMLGDADFLSFITWGGLTYYSNW